ncbi:hypothetical protein B0A49_03336 [Cryomyces minteri]|uniref:BZIP domain-containing protein n=2 Tax=Cryomyces minteri TaxID=331657 RepID=A0A4U0XKR8_9PEZI|nr:hypothetical protein B0A49_03336 [Cryomyces minteri]
MSTNTNGFAQAQLQQDHPGASDSAHPSNAAPSNGTAPKKRRASNGPSSSRGVANLTPEQLAKKRANDREAQRAIRERTRNQIETLEKRIKELESQQPYQELQIVLRQRDDALRENEEIRSRLQGVMGVLSPLLGGGVQGLDELAAAAHPRSPLPLPQQTLDVQPQHRNRSQEPDPRNPPQLQPQNGPYFQQPTSSMSETSSAHPDGPSSAGHTPNARQYQFPGIPPTSNIRGGWSPPSDLADHQNPFDQQRNNLLNGLSLELSGERLALGFLLDHNQKTGKHLSGLAPQAQMIAPRASTPGSLVSTSTQPPYYRTTSGQHPPPQAPLPCDPRLSPGPLYSFLPRTVDPTCPLDSLLLDFLAERRQRAADGVTTSSLVGPAYPSISSLLNPDRSVYSHPLSKVFTDILSKFPDLSDLPEQVAVLYVMFLFMRWNVAPTAENYDRLPPWMKPSERQLTWPHPAWIDHLPWPSMRDKVSEAHSQYPFDSFFVPYTTTLSLNWPYEPTDCLLTTAVSKDVVGEGEEELSINPVFERHLRNLENWSLGTAFRRAHPGLCEGVRIQDKERRHSR